MKIRVSERGTFKRCRKRWDYSSPSRQNLTTVSGPIALQFGSMMHKTLETWATDLSQNPDDVFMGIAKETMKSTRDRYQEIVGVSPSEAEMDLFYDHVVLGRDLIHSYDLKWHSPTPEGFTLYSNEQTFLVDIPGTSHQLQGTLDGLLERDGLLYVLERKTYSSRPRKDVLASNDQFLAYLWAVGQIVGDSSKVGGLVYDGMWKRKLEGKRTLDDILMRTILLRPPEELEQFGRYLTEEVADMTDSNVRVYLNRRWEGCFDCPFEPLCTAESKNEDSDYIRRTRYTQAPQSLVEDEEANDYTETTGTHS